MEEWSTFQSWSRGVFGLLLPSLLLSLAVAEEADHESAVTVINFSEPSDAALFTTQIPNRYTEVRDGVLWTRGRDKKAKYPPMVYYPLDGSVDLEIQFRYRQLGEGGWLWFFVDADDGGGGIDHCLRVRLSPTMLSLQVDGKTSNPSHPNRQPSRKPDKVSGLYRVPEKLPPIKLDLAPRQWRTVALTFRDDKVTVSLEDPAWSKTLERPNFPHPKRKLLWMQQGGAQGIEIDDLRVTLLDE